MVNIKDLPKAERPREKLIRYGASALSATELLAVLISSGNQDDSALSLAARVLSLDPKGLNGLYDLQPEELMKIKGIGPAAAGRILAALELGKRLACAPPDGKIEVNDPKSVADIFMGDMRHLRQEKLQVLMLNTKGEFMAREDVCIGGTYSAFAGPREVFANAVRRGAYGVIIAHNHPSGDPSPSSEDLALTRQLAAAGKVLGIELLDHIIIGDGRFISLRQQGVFKSEEDP